MIALKFLFMYPFASYHKTANLYFLSFVSRGVLNAFHIHAAVLSLSILCNYCFTNGLKLSKIKALTQGAPQSA